MRRENEGLETYKKLHETRNQLAEKELKKFNEAVAERDKFVNDYHTIRDMKRRKEATRSNLMEAARNEALSSIIKAIYITALEVGSLTDDGIILAESMVDKWIQENGGASKILNKVGNNTYLLARITQICEDAAEASVEEVEDIEKDDAEEENKDKAEAIEKAKEFIQNADSEDVKDFMNKIVDTIHDKGEQDATSGEDTAEKSEEEKEESKDADNDSNDTTVDVEPEKETEVKVKDADSDEELDIEIEDDEDSKDEEETSEEKEDESPAEDDTDSSDDEDTEVSNGADPLSDVDDSDDEESEEDSEDDIEDDESADSEPLDDDGIDKDTTIDGDLDNDGKVFDDLDKEEDVQKAIELIRTRVADAEENFIRNNAEDKKKVDDLLNKISTNVKTVEDLNDKNEKKAEIAKEAVRMYKRQIDSIRENRALTVFEKMTRNLTSQIVTNESVLPNYITESGSIDMDLIVESARVMYAFLETVNTLQLATVDEKYIKNILDNM